MVPKSYFQMTLEKTIRQTEKLLKILQAVQTDYADKRMEAAMEKAVSAVKQAEEVALLTRALPAHTGHPRAKELTHDAIAEAIPIEIGFTDQGWFCLRMPILLPRKEKSSRSYLRGFLYPALEEFTAKLEPIRYPNCVMIFRHVYDHRRPEREYRDHDNIELNAVVDALAMFLLPDDSPMRCRHYYCSAAGTIERTEVYLVPRAEYPNWLMEKANIPDDGMPLMDKIPERYSLGF